MGTDEFNGGSPIASRSLFTVFSSGESNKKTASSSGFSIRIHPVSYTHLMSLALEKTGGAEFISNSLVNGLGSYGPLALMAGIYFTTSLMTMFISNTATAVLLAPIALQSALQILSLIHIWCRRLCYSETSGKRRRQSGSTERKIAVQGN